MEGVGSVVESSRKMAGKCYRHNGQHQTGERDHSIHDVGGGSRSPDNGWLGRTRRRRLYTGQLTTTACNDGTHARMSTDPLPPAHPRRPGKCVRAGRKLRIVRVSVVGTRQMLPPGRLARSGRRYVCIGIRTGCSGEASRRQKLQQSLIRNWASSAMLQGPLLPSYARRMYAVQFSETIRTVMFTDGGQNC